MTPPILMIQSNDYNDKKLPWSVKPNMPLLNTLRTGDANLRFYITTVQDG